MKLKQLLFVQLIPVIFFSTGFFHPVFSQTSEERLVYFKDKNGTSFSISRPLEFLTQKAIDRRNKQGISITEQDLPVNIDYINQIKDLGATVSHGIKWFNAAIVTADEATFTEIENLAFVEKVNKIVLHNDPNRRVRISATCEVQVTEEEICQEFEVNKIAEIKDTEENFDYGNSLAQIQMLGVDKMHEQGYLGQGIHIAVLDGGLPEWMSKKYATQKKYSSPQAKGDFIADIKEELFTNFSGVNRFSKIEDTLIFDARSFERFRGEVPEPRKGLRSGIIPNSVNLPYTKLLNGHTLKSEEELKSVFETFANNRERFVFSCGSGVTACNLALGASVVGYKNLVVYDGSWTEYGTLTPIPMETSNWNKDELMAYILLYAAHSDFKENNHERNVIISKVDMQTFQKVHDEFSQDNDFQSIQKILASIETHKYSSEKIDEILADIKGLFFADSDFDIKEHSMLLFLKRILK